MRRYLSLLLFVGITLAQNTVVAVFDFENNGLNDAQVRQVRSRLESELEKAGGLAIFERKQINEVLKEQKLQISGIVDDGDLVEIGSMAGATHILSGSVGKMDDTFYTISAKLVNTASGKVEQTASYDAEKGISDLMKNGLKSLARDLVKIEMEMSGDLQYEFSIGKIFIDDRDFTRSGFGNPLNIGIAVWEDRNIIERINVGKVRGLEGINRTLPIELKLNSVYKLYIGETDGIISTPKVYEWNATWEGVEKAKVDDDWFFNKGKLKIGNKSYIEVIQNPLFPVDK
jgi:TolB-like protein